MGSALERHTDGRDLPTVREESPRARRRFQIHPDPVELPALRRRCRSRAGVGTERFNPAGKARQTRAESRACRGLPPDLPRFRMALSPSARSANGSIAAETSDPAGDGPGVRRRLSLPSGGNHPVMLLSGASLSPPLWSRPAPR